MKEGGWSSRRGRVWAKKESKLNSRDKWRGVDLPGKLSRDPWRERLGSRNPIVGESAWHGQVRRGRRLPRGVDPVDERSFNERCN